MSGRKIKMAAMFAAVILAVTVATVLMVNLPERSSEKSEAAQTAPAVYQTEETEAWNEESTAPEETLPPETQASRVVSRGNEGPVEYDLENINRSHKVNYQDNTNYYTFYPVLSGDAAGIEAINADLLRIAEDFMQQKSPAEITETHFAYGRQFCFSHTQAFVITHNGDGMISFRIGEGGFWGNEEKGRYDVYYGRTYHLGTGQILSITDLVDMEPETLLKRIREILMKEAENRGLDMNADDVNLETVPFWIWEGELHVALYDDPDSPYDTYSVGTGIFVT